MLGVTYCRYCLEFVKNCLMCKCESLRSGEDGRGCRSIAGKEEDVSTGISCNKEEEEEEDGLRRKVEGKKKLYPTARTPGLSKKVEGKEYFLRNTKERKERKAKEDEERKKKLDDSDEDKRYMIMCFDTDSDED